MMVKKICLRQGIGSFMAEAATSILDTSYVSVSGIMDSWGDVPHDQGSARSIKNRYDPFTNFPRHLTCRWLSQHEYGSFVAFC